MVEAGDLAHCFRDAAHDAPHEILVYVPFGDASVGKGYVSQIGLPSGPSISQLVEATVGGYTKQPGPHGVCRRKTIKVSIGANERVLGGVLGRVNFTEQTPATRVDRPAVCAIERLHFLGRRRRHDGHRLRSRPVC